MSRIFGMVSPLWQNRLRKLLIFAWVIAAVLFGIFIYFLIIHPVLTNLIIPSTDFQVGAQTFLDGSYLQYESGDRFAALLEETKFPDAGNVVDFCHVDNHMRDNPLYGKICDVFSLDVQLAQEIYAALQKNVQETAKSYCQFDDFVLYLMDQQTEGSRDIVLIALCDQESIARLVLLTDLTTEYTAYDCKAILSRQAPYMWDVTSNAE